MQKGTAPGENNYTITYSVPNSTITYQNYIHDKIKNILLSYNYIHGELRVEKQIIRSVSQEISSPLWNSKVYFRANKSTCEN